VPVPDLVPGCSVEGSGLLWTWSLPTPCGDCFSAIVKQLLTNDQQYDLL
jgi:hypothetical protein